MWSRVADRLLQCGLFNLIAIWGTSMKKLIVAGMVVALGLAPALASAQAGGGTSGSGSSGSGSTGSPSGSSPSGTGNSAPSSPPSSSPSTPGSTTTPGPTSPGPGTGAPNSSGSPSTGSSGSSSTQRFTNKADCERAGGKWQGATRKCDMGG